MSFGTFVFSVEEEKIHSHLENVLHLQSCLFLNIVGRISVSMQNMSAFLKDSFVSTKLLLCCKCMADSFGFLLVI